MKTPLIWKIKSFVWGIIRALSHHFYGCCENQFKDCRKCKYVIEDGDAHD